MTRFPAAEQRQGNLQGHPLLRFVGLDRSGARSGPVLSLGLGWGVGVMQSPLPVVTCPFSTEVRGSAGTAYITSPVADEAAAGAASLPHTSITSLQWVGPGPWVEAKPGS